MNQILFICSFFYSFRGHSQLKLDKSDNDGNDLLQSNSNTSDILRDPDHPLTHIHPLTVLIQYPGLRTNNSTDVPPTTSRNLKTKRVSSLEANFYMLALNHIFVDKSLFIRDLFYKTGHKTILLTRPRKFGKSTALSMLKHFLQLHAFESHSFYDKPMEDVFDGLDISKYKDICENHKHKYAVIHIDFKGAGGQDEIQVQHGIEGAIQKALGPHFHFLGKILRRREGLDYYRRTLRRVEEQVSKHHPIGWFGHAIGTIMDIYHERLGIQVIVLIDEYDTPFIAAYERHHFEKTFAYIKPILLNCLKSENLHKAYITGISTVAQQGLFSSLSELCSVIDDTIFTSYFGFKKEEVDQLIQKTGIPVNSGALNEWYNGYHFGKDVIFNPFSIIRCLEEGGDLQSYWIKSGSSIMFERLARLGGAYIQNHFDVLLDHKTIEKKIYSDLNFYNLESEEESFWTLIVQAGYLNAEKKPLSSKSENAGGLPSFLTEDKQVFTLRIPNKEIYDEFQKIYNNISVGAEKTEINKLATSVLNRDVENIQKQITHFLQTPHCFFDFNTVIQVRKFQVFISGFLLQLRSEYCFVQITGIRVGATILKPYDSKKQTIVIMITDQTKEEFNSDVKDNTLVEKEGWIRELFNMNVGNMTLKRTILLNVSPSIISTEIVDLLHHYLR